MASKRICTACQRYCQSNIARLSISQPLSTYHTFSTTSHSSAAHATASKTHTPVELGSLKAPASSKNAKTKSKPQPPPEASPASKIAQQLRKRASSVTETYIAYGASEQLIKECARPAEYSIPQSKEKGAETPKTKDGEDLGVGEGWWYTELGLAPTFNTWAQITFLHMYLLTTRIRCFPAEHAPTWHQHLLDHFFYEAEKRMTVLHQLQARGVRNRYLKDLFVQWRGLMAGYDEGLMKGDAVLAAAVWRNVFKADEEVDLRGVGLVVSYMRRVLRTLESVEDEVLVSGRIRFGDPSSQVGTVQVRSKMMDVPVTEEEIRPAKGKA